MGKRQISYVQQESSLILRHFKNFVLKNRCKISDASVRIRTVIFFRWIQHCRRSADINDMGLNTCWCQECKYIKVIARINIIIQNYRGNCHWTSWPHSDLLCSLQMSISLPVLRTWHYTIQRDRDVQYIKYENVKAHLNSVTSPQQKTPVLVLATEYTVGPVSTRLTSTGCRCTLPSLPAYYPPKYTF